jgi:hypothetical protein
LFFNEAPIPSKAAGVELSKAVRLAGKDLGKLKYPKSNPVHAFTEFLVE